MLWVRVMCGWMFLFVLSAVNTFQQIIEIVMQGDLPSRVTIMISSRAQKAGHLGSGPVWVSFFYYSNKEGLLSIIREIPFPFQ